MQAFRRIFFLREMGVGAVVYAGNGFMEDNEDNGIMEDNEDNEDNRDNEDNEDNEGNEDNNC